MYSSTITVTVRAGEPPRLDHIVEQGKYQYQLRQGDLNGDGRTDLHVRRTSGGTSDNGVLYEALLQQQGDGTFAPLGGATASQLGVGRGWPVSSATVVQSDFNADGYNDLLLLAGASGEP